MKQFLKKFFLLLSCIILIYGIQLFWNPGAETGQPVESGIAWTLYQNPKYGFQLEIPSGWVTDRSIHGIEMSNPQTGKIYRVRAMPDESETYLDPTPDYLIQKLPQHHPYLADTLPAVRSVRSESGLAGFTLNSRFRPGLPARESEKAFLRQFGDSSAVLTYYPSLFTGDQFTNSIELFTAGSEDSVYSRMVRSFGYMFPVLSEKELLSLKLIDSSERPFESARYVGETQGFWIDVSGDSKPELLIVGFYRLYDVGEAKCFFRLMKRTETGMKKALQEYFLENSFGRSDIQVGNLNEQPGYEVLVRFSDYGSPWGSNSTALIHFDSLQYKLFRFGSFAEIRDLNNDGVDEIVKSVNTQFSLGAIATWRDIYVFRDGTFVEDNAAFSAFYRTTVLPHYREQMILARNEIMETNVPRIRLSLYYLVRRLDRYIRAAEQLAQGKPAGAS